MSESLTVLGELQADFTERNTALFLLLGILSAGDRLTQSVGHAAPAPPQTATTVDYFTLGLIALTEHFRALATRCVDDAPARRADIELVVPLVEDLLR